MLGAIGACNPDDQAAQSPTETSPPRATPPPSASSPSSRRTITLITGDRVVVGPNKAVEVVPGKGRERIGYTTHRRGDQITVLPNDAAPLVHAGKLDPRLFDVTRLLEQGNDRLAYTPVLIKHDATATMRASVATLGPSVVRELASVHAVAARADRTGGLWRTLVTGSTTAARLAPGVTKIWLDGLRKPSLDVSVPLIGAPVAWQQGLDGTGVTVAVLDTGIDVTHPDLADRVIGRRNFMADDPELGEDDLDHVGHGTHVASTVAGTGAASNGRYRGVAPGAHLLDGKVCTVFGCFESAILAGMEWAADSGAKVINMSFGDIDSPGIDPVEEAVNTLTAEKGVLFVVAAGNDGQALPVSTPASADAALAVAAFDKQDQLEDFSSRGPRVGDNALKPEISAPGGNIVAARSKDGQVGAPGDLYVELSGTSMATPHVSGAAAILVQQHPDATPAELKALLMASAKPNPNVDSFSQGAGRVDVARAIRQTITTEPAAISCGLQLYPHDDDVPVSTPVRYHNSGTTAVTLSFASHAVSRDGVLAPSSMFTTSSPTLTVPANGTASIDLICDTRVGGPTGIVGGDITATGPGDVVVETPIGVLSEIESYALTIHWTGRNGRQPDDAAADVLTTSLDVLGAQFDLGRPTVRLARSSYIVNATMAETRADGSSDRTVLFAPSFELDRDLTVEMDAALAKPLAVDVHDATVVPQELELDSFFTIFNREGGAAMVGTLVSGPGSDHFYSGQTRDEDVPNLNFGFDGLWAQPGHDGSFVDSPYVYRLVYSVDKRVPSGFTRDVHRDELAALDIDNAAQAPGDMAQLLFFVEGTSGPLGFSIAVSRESTFHLPRRQIQFVNTDDGITWDPTWLVTGSDGSFEEADAENPQSYSPGQHVHLRWNRAVFQPRFGDEFASTARQGAILNPNVPGLSDASRIGVSARDSIDVTLTKDGVPVPPVPVGFQLPPENGHYQLAFDSTSTRADVPSTSVHVAWSFDSAFTDDVTTIPMATIAFDPILDDTNSALAGFPWLVPLDVATSFGSTPLRLHRPTVDASYDNGATWHSAFVFGLAGHWQALVIHPRTPGGWVSLRTHASDDAGHAVDETVIQAYRLR